MAALPRVPTVNATSYTLDAQIAAGGNVITLNSSVAGIVRAPGYCWIDRIDSAGNETPTKREYKKFTGVSGATLTGVTNVDGTDQVHAVGAIVEFGPTVNHENDLYDALKVEHNDAGTHSAITATTIVASGAVTADSLVSDSLTAEATNGDLTLAGNGTGKAKLQSFYGGITTATPDAAATATLNLATTNKHNITMPAGNITIALSNAAVGQCFTIRILQDGVGSRTVTWFATIRWSGGSAPTLTTTGAKADMFGFVVTGAGTYDGFVIGQNI